MSQDLRLSICSWVGRLLTAGVLSFVLLMLPSCRAADLRTVPEPANSPGQTALADKASLLDEDIPPVRQDLVSTPTPLTADSALSDRVEPVRTPWGGAWDREQLCRNMDQILKENGVESSQTRVRMTAHAIVASGWRQSLWHHNVWGVKRGSWDGPWFRKSTREVDQLGFEKVVFNADWRAFSSWSEAVDDYRARITRSSRRPSYRKAARFLRQRDNRADADYWKALNEGNYYTTQTFTPRDFASLCFLVRRVLRSPQSS